jgi:carnitine 3-dehydrogenase
MSESCYLQVFGDAMDALYRRVGVDEDYRAAAHMFYTVESHLVHKAEARVNEPLEVTTQLLALDNKRLHVFHRLYRTSDATLLATVEQMHLHVDTANRKAAPIHGAVRTRLEELASAHANLPVPPEAGRHVGARVQ